MRTTSTPTTITQSRFTLSFDLCAYCGIEVATNNEDPIPKCLYPKDQRHGVKFLKIPACRKCNVAKSQYDANLRDYLVMNRRSSEHPLLKQIFKDTFWRAVETNRVRLLNHYFQGNDVDFITESGIWAGRGYEIPIDIDLVIQALEWLLRGLHWAVFKTPISSSHAGVGFLMDHELPPYDGLYRQGSQFTCAWIVFPEGDVFWALGFFGREIMTGVTQNNSNRKLISV